MATRLTRNTVAQPGGLGGERIGGLLPVGGVELLQVARDALLDLGTPPRHLGTREVPVAVVHRLELAAVDRNAGGGQEAHRAAQPDEACANLADGAAIVLAEVRDGLVIGDETPRQPHHLDVASGLPLQPSTGLHPVQVAVDVELEQDRGMIGRPARRLGHDTVEPELPQVDRIHEGVDHADRVVLVDPVIQARRKQRRLTAIRHLQQNAPSDSPAVVEKSYHRRRFYTWGNSGIEPYSGSGNSSPGTDKADVRPRNHGEPQWSTMSDWTCR